MRAHRRASRVSAIGLVSLFATGYGPVAAQEADCGDRASLLVTVLDESGSVVLPGATVVLRWTDAERMPVREATDTAGRVLVCVPGDPRQAVLWAEFGDDSSGQVTTSALERGVEREVQCRILLWTTIHDEFGLPTITGWRPARPGRLE
ncbi:hypothetical protein [Candidatus Palauibacter sp.]|uniref:hypothetical protein n=1 Tax=Candidatus Palauibacter sp. TaxID=3101350 RepID=UPI003C6FE722